MTNVRVIPSNTLAITCAACWWGHAPFDGALCEDCETEAYSPLSQSGWVRSNFDRIADEDREHWWEQDSQF